MMIDTKSNAARRARLNLVSAVAGAALDEDQPSDSFVQVMQGRREALRRLEAIIAKGSTTIVELEAILPLLEGFEYRLLEDVVGCFARKLAGGKGDGWQILRSVADELKNPRWQYQSGRRAPVPYRAIG